MKGILLGGGAGSRLSPVTSAVNKHLLPVYDKPLTYYPLSVLMLSGIRQIMLIARPEDIDAYRRLLGDGDRIGIEITYAVQEEPRGVADAFLIAGRFIEGEQCAVALGDNIFFGHRLRHILARASEEQAGGRIFAYWVQDPGRFGVVAFDEDGRATSLEEKPAHPKSNFAMPSLYFYDEQVLDFARRLTPSARGEFEITDINLEYMRRDALSLVRLERGFAWLDTDTVDSLLDASNYVATIERRQGLKIACVEEVAWRLGWIDDADLLRSADAMGRAPYADYLRQMLTFGRL
jgi:glucose-1-phosphate thymidylyltransferase